METALSDIGPRFPVSIDLRALGETAGRSDIISFLPAAFNLASRRRPREPRYCIHQSSSRLAAGRQKRRRRKGRGITMFKELLPLLEGRTMILTAAKIGDALAVTIYPKRNGERDENPVGNTPLCVTGTAEELDHELPGLIAGYVEELGKLRSNLDQSSSSSPASSAATSTGVVSSSSPHPISFAAACTDSAGLAGVTGSGSNSSSSDAMPIGCPASAGMGAAAVSGRGGVSTALPRIGVARFLGDAAAALGAGGWTTFGAVLIAAVP